MAENFLHTITYRGFEIDYDRDSHFWSGYKYLFSADGFDGAEDSGDYRYGSAKSVEEALLEIDDLWLRIEEDPEFNNKKEKHE